MSIESGTLVEDALTGDEVFVLGPTGNTADEQVVAYDYNKNEITLFEAEKDKEYDCSPNDIAVEVVYPDRLETLTDTRTPPVETVRELIEKQKVKPYYFSINRLRVGIN